MRKKWEPKDATIENIDKNHVYLRTEASERLGMSENVFSREIKDNCLFIAFGNTVISGKTVMYPGQELLDQIERLQDDRESLELIASLMRHTPQKFKKDHNGKSKAVVFEEGNYLNGLGWCGSDWEVPKDKLA